MKSLTRKQQLELLNKYLPENIVAHCIKVNKVAVFIGKEFMKKRIDIDIKSLDAASLLHDIARIVDIRDFNSNFNVSEEKLEFWKQLREKYKGKNHEIAGAQILRDLNLNKEADLLIVHGYHNMDNLKTWEEKIICYSDKRVKHDKIVS